MPLLAITTVTATFARLTLTLFAGLVCFIGYVAISLLFLGRCLYPLQRSPLDASRLLFLRDGGSAAIRGPQSLGLSAASDCSSGPARAQRHGGIGIYRDRPRLSSRRVPRRKRRVQLTLLRDTPHPATAYLIRAKQVQVSIPLQASGVAEGYALIGGPVKVTVDAANGSHWTSPWQASNNQQYLPGTSESWITLQMSRAFFDQVRSTPVTLHFTVALTRVQAGNVRSIPLPAQDFSVPDFGICSPQPDFLHSVNSSESPAGLPCTNPALLTSARIGQTVRARHRSPARTQAFEGDAWIGSLENSPADFGIAPSGPHRSCSPTRRRGKANKSEPRHLCPGTPVTFTQYNFVGQTQYDFTIPDFRLPGYQPDMGSPTGSMGFDITTQR